MSEYTEGRWEILPEEPDKPYIRIRGSLLGHRYKIANVLNPYDLSLNTREAEETRANARRIVACVNACAGIDTERLEQCDQSNAKEMVDLMLRWKDQRDALLIELKDIVENGIAPQKVVRANSLIERLGAK